MEFCEYEGSEKQRYEKKEGVVQDKLILSNERRLNFIFIEFVYVSKDMSRVFTGGKFAQSYANIFCAKMNFEQKTLSVQFLL